MLNFCHSYNIKLLILTQNMLLVAFGAKTYPVSEHVEALCVSIYLNCEVGM